MNSKLTQQELLDYVNNLPIEERLALESQIFILNCQSLAQQRQEFSSAKAFNKEIENQGLDKKDVAKRLAIAETFSQFKNLHEVGSVSSLGVPLLLTLAGKAYGNVRDELREEVDIFQLVATEKIKQAKQLAKLAKSQVQQEPKSKIKYVGKGRVAKIPAINEEKAIASLLRQEETNLTATIITEAIIYREEIQLGKWVKVEEAAPVINPTVLAKLNASLEIVAKQAAIIEKLEKEAKEKAMIRANTQDSIPFGQNNRQDSYEELTRWNRLREAKINSMLEFAAGNGLELDQLALFQRSELVFVHNKKDDEKSPSFVSINIAAQ